jgi:hypothetical protein
MQWFGFGAGFPFCPLCTEVLVGILPLVPPGSQTSQLYDWNHVHISSIMKHGKHYVLLLWEEVIAYRLQVPLYLEPQRVHNTKVPTWHKLPFSENSFRV